MNKLLCGCFGVVLSLGATLSYAGQRDWSPEDFVTVSGAASPQVSYAVQRDRAGLRVAVSVFSLSGDGRDASVSLGVAAADRAVLGGKDAQSSFKNGSVLYEFAIPAKSLVTDATDWERLRLAFAVAWSGGPLGQDRQRERYRHIGYGATHAGLSTVEFDWMPLNLAEHALGVADRKNRIQVAFKQPMDGKATIVIEDEKGNRVRNLIAGQPYGKGAQQVEWDGLDEQGKVVKPGAYRWRSIHHPGIRPNYLFSFGNDGNPPWRTGTGTDMWGPDHSVLSSAAANSEYTFLGGPVAESGYAMVALDAAGIKRKHFNPASGTGIYKICLAADETYLYAAHDGCAWGQHIDRSKPDWKAEQKISVTRFDIKSSRVAEYGKGRKFVVVASNEVGPGSVIKDENTSLQGMAFVNGLLYISDYHKNRVLIVDAATGENKGDFKLDKPGPLTAMGGDLLAVSGGSVQKISLPGNNATVFMAAGNVEPRGLAVDAKRNVYISDGKTQTVMVFDAGGRKTGSMGKPGGRYAGAYDIERMVNPNAMVVASNGWLWVCEDRNNPKRCVAWDLSSGRVIKDKFGPTAYGASGAGLDPDDHTRWIGQGAMWDLDFSKKSSACRSILGLVPGNLMHWHVIRQNGRTFLYGMGQSNMLCEQAPDGSVRPLACFGSAHHFNYSSNWNPPAAFIEAYTNAYPDGKYKPGKSGWPGHGPGMLWVDRNGDMEMQAGEIELSTNATAMAGASWGHELADLTIHVPVTAGGKPALAVLKPDGFDEHGVPKYPKLCDAIAAAVQLRDVPPTGHRGIQVESAVDRWGNVILKTDPAMTSFAPDGSFRWSYPNRWSDVHGSHDAPLPETGVMQGTLFFLGMAPLDDKADVFMMNGNHGRFFVLTSDGFYLDEMFKDVRMGASLDAYLIGGECFGGSFGKSAKDGNYYLQSGHTDYRIFRLSGLNEIKRSEGKIKVTPQQVIAAERAQAGKVAQVAARKEASIPFVTTPPVIDGKEDGWPGEYTAKWDKSGQFPVQVRAAYDDQNLYLLYNVTDQSPWVNKGKDSALLFKTGDSVDLQIGVNASANPARSQPVPGDIRLLIAPFQGKETAVLYRHRLAQKENPVTFTCPWRSEIVDSVKVLESAKIAVTREGGRYRVEVAIPLADLGLANAKGQTLKADFGAIFGDPDGTINMLRSYWANQNTMLVNDVPGEIMLNPNLWGTVKFTDK